MDPHRVNIRTSLLKFKNCITCQDASTDSDSDDDVKVQNVFKKVKGFSKLHLAAKRGDAEAVRRLLRSSANVDALDSKHNTPLHWATLNGHIDVINLLLSNDANVYTGNAGGQTSVRLESENDHFGTAQLLLNNSNAVLRRQAAPLYVEAQLGHTDTLKSLIIKGANVNACNKAKMTPLHLACRNGHTSIVEILLDNHATVDFETQSKVTPLHIAANGGHEDIVQKLIISGANVNSCNKEKMTALHLACRNGHTSIVETLLNNHAIVDVMEQCKATPFYLAAENGHAHVTDLLLSRGVCDFMLTYTQATPLHVAVRKGHANVVEIILKHSRRITDKLIKDDLKPQANTNSLIETSGIHPIQLLMPDGRRVSAGLVWTEISQPLEIWREYYKTALDVAVYSAQAKMVELLLNADQCRFSEEHLSRSFYELILSISHYKADEYRNNNGDANVRSYDDKDEIFCENVKKIARALCNSNKFNVNHPDETGKTCIHEVMYFMHIDTITVHVGKQNQMIWLAQLLLKNGADFNLKNSDGETPLMIASKHCCFNGIQALIDWEQKSGMKLDLDARDQFGATALIKAAESNHVSVMRLLLHHNASVNLYDHFGFTALHAVVYELNTDWIDFYFFCKGIPRRNIYYAKSRETRLKLGRKTVDPHTVMDQLQSYLQNKEETIPHREEAVKLLLDIDKINVNAIDFRGNTPLDLAMMSSKRINSTILKALKNRGAFRNSKEPEDKESIEIARVDNRGWNPLHRLIMSRISGDPLDRETIQTDTEHDSEQLDLLVNGILLSPDNFRESAIGADHKGRTPLHYAAMSSSRVLSYNICDIMRVLLEIGSEANAVDIYGRTPLHYAKRSDQHELLVKYGADENKVDNFGNTTMDIAQLSYLQIINEKRAEIWKNSYLDLSVEIAQVFSTNLVTELTRRKLVETIRIYPQSLRPEKTSEELVWKIWSEDEFIRLNRRLSQLKPSVQHFVERLADGIKKMDWRFECQPNLVGSAEEETKVVLSADFDFNFRLIKISQICDPFPHPLGPKGYFQLKRKSNENTEIESGNPFDIFFNKDHCFLADEVNSRFKMILGEVLGDSDFWKEEHHFDFKIKQRCTDRYGNLDGLCETVFLRMVHPIADGEGDFLCLKISIDIVPCIHVEDWWPEDALPVDMCPAVKTDGCTFVFHRPNYKVCKPRGTHFIFSESYARISFAPLESRNIKESSPLIKAAYIVCKGMLYSRSGTSYQLKNCLLFCMEALNTGTDIETRSKEEFTPKQLAFWVERIMFCFLEFSRHHIYPCYFMPSFRRRVDRYSHHHLKRKNRKVDLFSDILTDYRYPLVCVYYLDLCPDGSTAFDIPLESRFDQRQLEESMYDPNGDPMWEQFDREVFIRALSSRNSN